MIDEKIRTFTDLRTWQEGHKLVLQIYKVTEQFPRSEQFGLTSQMRRCVVSITSNIAEGFGRMSKKEKIRFYYISAGSLTELYNQVIISKDVGMINEGSYLKLIEQITTVQKLTHGLIRSIKATRLDAN